MTLPSPPPEGGSRLNELVEVMARLRAPGGCPWDAAQTHESLVTYLVEETHELIEAIETGDRDAMLEELGDVLYSVLFHADIAASTPGEDFDIQDVARQMTEKMVGRHPHVFGDVVAHTAADVVGFWDELKAKEKPDRSSVLDGIPQAMPALALADKVLGRAAKVGLVAPDVLDASDVPGVPDVRVGSVGSEEELGELLLSIVAAAKAQGLDSERALRSALRTLQAEIRAAEAGVEPSGA